MYVARLFEDACRQTSAAGCRSGAFIRTSLVSSAALAAALACFSSSVSAETLTDCGKRAESVAFLVDVSGSMQQPMTVNEESNTTEKKLVLARQLTQAMHQAASAKADFKTSLSTVAPYTELAAADHYSTEQFAEVAAKLNPTLEVFGRPTWIGNRALEQLSAVSEQPEVLILITDGVFSVRDTRSPKTPTDLLTAYKKAHPTSSVYVISAAATPNEAAAVKRLAQSLEAPTLPLADLLSQPAGIDDFVKSTLWRDCTKPVISKIEIQGINFDFDKSIITPDAQAILDQALAVVRARPADETITIAGWTDWMGSDAYNQGLSQRRAESVRRYFVNNGIDARRLTAEGHGKSFKYSNHDKHGRWLNRRVDLIFGGGALRSLDVDEAANASH